MSNPRARTADLTVRDLDGQLVVHDHRADAWHTLDVTAAAVYRAADGSRDVEALAETTGLTTGAAQDALASLAEADLVSVPAGMSRRSLLAHGAGIAGVAGVLTMAAPAVAGAQSNGGPGPGGGAYQPGSRHLYTTNAADGTNDPRVEELVGSVWQAAQAYNNGLYTKYSGTGYVGNGGSPDDGGTVSNPVTHSFRIAFNLPAGFTNVSLTGSVRADNAVTVKAPDGSTITVMNYGNSFQAFNDDNAPNPPSGKSFTYSGANHFNNGTNYLYFDVQNFGGPYGVDFDVNISFS